MSSTNTTNTKHKPVLVTSSLTTRKEVETLQEKRSDSTLTPPPPPPLVVQEESGPEEPVLSPQEIWARRSMTRSAIVSNGAVRTVCQIIMNGTRMSGHQHVNFITHEGLLIKLLRAYEKPDKQEAEEAFLDVLKTYLEQASLYLPQAGRLEDVPIIIDLLKLLIHEHEAHGGFDEVARYILASANAPVDRF